MVASDFREGVITRLELLNGEPDEAGDVKVDYTFSISENLSIDLGKIQDNKVISSSGILPYFFLFG